MAYERALAVGNAEVAVACAIAAAQPLMAQGRRQRVADMMDAVWGLGLRRPELHMRRALALCFLGRAEEAEETLRAAHVRCRDPVIAGRYARFRSVALRLLSRPRDAVEVLERSWPAQERAGDPRYAESVGELGRCLLAAGRPWEAEAYLALALEGSRRDVGRCIYGSSRSLVHMFMGSFDDAVRGFLAALADQEVLGLWTTSLGSRSALAVSYWLRGRPAEAHATVERLIADADRVGFAEDAMAGRVLLAHVMVELGDASGAEGPAVAAFEALPGPDHRRACEVWMARASVCWAQGRYDDARAFALEAPEVPETLGWEWTLADQALALARCGLHDACEARLERLEESHNPWRYSVAAGHLARAEVAQARGDDPTRWLRPCDEGLRGMQWGSPEAPLLRVRRTLD